MAESEVVRIAREFREQLARNEDAALRLMSDYWVKMENELLKEFRDVSLYIIDLQTSGQSVPLQVIEEQERYQQMLMSIQKLLPEYEANALDVIETYQRENFILGLDSASAGLRYANKNSLIWNEVSKDSAETVVGFAGNGSPLMQLLQQDYADLATAITDELVKGVALGKGAKATADAMTKIMGEKEFSRSVRIARTEINRAYRIANAEQYAKSGVVTKVLRLCYPPTACLACLMLDGKECPNGLCEDHPNGKCTTVAVTIGGNVPKWQHGEDWLMEQTEADQRRIMGDGRYEMWKKDGVPLRDMVTMKENPIWGGSPQLISEEKLKEMLEDGLL